MSDGMTPKRILGKIINFMVERYFPNSAFYGKTFFNAFGKFQERGHLAQASTLWLTHYMARENADEMEIVIKGLTINGKLCGDFRITATKTHNTQLTGSPDA